MKRLNIMFSSDENYTKWIYDRSDWEQTRKDLNMAETISYLEKISRDFPGEYLYKPCTTQDDAEHRLEIMEELLAREELFQNISEFCLMIGRLKILMRDYKEDNHNIQRQYRFLLLFGEFAAMVIHLKIILSDAKSAGFKAVYDFCAEMMDNTVVQPAYDIAVELLCEIGSILKNTGISINPSEKLLTVTECEEAGEIDILSADIFDVYGLKIKNSFSIVDPMPLSYLEEKVLETIMANYEETFGNLEIFFNNYSEQFMDDIKILIELLPQFSFYIIYIEFIKNAAQNYIPVCKPIFDKSEKSGFNALDCTGIAMIIKFLAENQPLENIIRNDIRLPKGGIFILSGPNQGGKTIYLKMLGATAYLAKCGCYVFCRECRMPFYENILTHFMQKEILGKSRLVEEIDRIESIANQFNSDSLVLLNESFTSTRRKDSVEIAVNYIRKFDELGCSVGFVSHFYEIPEIYKNGGNAIISLRSGIGDGGARTYKISEQKGDGLAYARDIARNCGMTYEQLSDEIKGTKVNT